MVCCGVPWYAASSTPQPTILPHTLHHTPPPHPPTPTHPTTHTLLHIPVVIQTHLLPAPHPLQGPRLHGIPLPVIIKEAVYHGVAVGAYELYDYVDFTSWLHSALLQVWSCPIFYFFPRGALFSLFFLCVAWLMSSKATWT